MIDGSSSFSNMMVSYYGIIRPNRPQWMCSALAFLHGFGVATCLNARSFGRTTSIKQDICQIWVSGVEDAEWEQLTEETAHERCVEFDHFFGPIEQRKSAQPPWQAGESLLARSWRPIHKAGLTEESLSRGTSMQSRAGSVTFGS